MSFCLRVWSVNRQKGKNPFAIRREVNVSLTTWETCRRQKAPSLGYVLSGGPFNFSTHIHIPVTFA